MIDGSGEILEIARRINAELVESDFGNGSCKHVANIPPGKYELRENYQENKWKYFEHSVSCKWFIDIGFIMSRNANALI